MSSITVTNLNCGEVIETELELKFGGDNRFMAQGQKAYTTGMLELLEVLQASEIKRMVSMHNTTKVIGKCNIFQMSFREATLDMSPNTRSRLKKKLIEGKVIHEFGKDKIMLNPYIFLPRKDKNIHNSQYMTQILWKHTVEDKDCYVDGLEEFQDEILPNTRTVKPYLYVGTEKYGKYIKLKDNI